MDGCREEELQDIYNGNKILASDDDRKRKNYKLIIDPILEHGHSSKVYRFEGVIPGDPDPEPVIVADPRSRIKRYWNKKDVLDLQVPRFKHDVYYVGTILPKEVSFSNLNDNINLDFLINMCKGFGNIEDSKIYYHPKSKKHLGIGKVVFTSTRSAKLCGDKLNQTSRMGMLINAVVDPFGKERAMWIDSATGEKDKPHSLSPVHKGESEPRVYPSKNSESTNTSKRKGERQHHSRRGLKNNQKESLNKNVKSETHHNHQSRQVHPHGKVASIRELNNDENSQTSDTEKFQRKESSWNEEHYPDVKDGYENVISDRDNRKKHDRMSYCKHKHKDRHHRNNYDHRRDSINIRHKHRHRDSENHNSEGKEELNSGTERFQEVQETVSDEGLLLECGDSAVVCESFEETEGEVKKESEEPRLQSLESRIQSLLGGLVGGGRSSPPTGQEQDSEGELPKAPTPPPTHFPPPAHFPPPTHFPPPLPDEDAPPPLPPEPQPHHKLSTNKTRHIPLNGHVLNVNKRSSGDEDDHMSLSSIESDEEKIQVNPPTLSSDLPPPPQPPLPPLPPMPWQLPPPIEPAQTFTNDTQNSAFDQPTLKSATKPVYNLNQGEELREVMFTEVLDQVINQLKFIMRKDLCKKMVQDTAFSAYDKWWTSEQHCDKVVKPPGAALILEPETPVSATSTPLTIPSSTSTFQDPFKQPTTGMSGTIEALFDNKDVSGFGVGGLLGLRGGIPKMPSFRKKFLKPLTPPPEEDDDEDEEHEFVGPRTPEQSDSEAERVSDSGDDSVSESELKTFNEQHSRKVAIYSTDSDQSDDQSMLSDEDGSMSDEEEETQDRSGSEESEELSDVDVETTSPLPPSPGAAHEASPTWQPTSRQKGPASHTLDAPDKENQEIERATFPVLCKEESEEETSDDESFSVVKPTSARDSFGMKSLYSRFGGVEEALPRRTSQVSDNLEALQEAAHKQLEKTLQLAKLVLADHCYYFKDEPKKRPRDPLPAYPQEDSDLTDSASEGEPDMIPCLPANLASDHQYCAIYHPIDYALQYQKQRCKILGKTFDASDFYSAVESVSITDIAYETEISTDEVFKKYVNRTKTRKALTDVTNLKGSRELMSLLPPEVARKPIFKTRSFHEQQQFTYKFVYNGIDQEDINYLKRRYDELLQDDSPQTAWLNNVHWVDHPESQIPDPPVKRRRRNNLRRHVTGCARTEGFYKISHREKSIYLSDARGVNAYHTEEQTQESILWQLDKGRKQKAQQMREARSESRRWQTVLSSTGEDVGDLVKFNQLKFRKKALKFAKSGIHDWGLFALEPIASDEMVIEYVGQTIRQSTADLREKKYEQMGIGSSYMFRIDGDNIIDATKCGNLARFINHSCTPNCYAKIISVDGQKKIVIYSKIEIGVNEEITYDYKFPLEDEKIPCLCGTSACRGSLN